MTIDPRRRYTRQDLQVLDILQHPCWVFDIERVCMYWANAAAVRMWNAPSLEALQARDFVSDLTEATSRRLQDHLRHLREGKVFREQWTLYPNGRAKTVLMVGSAIVLHDGRIGLLAETELPDKQDFDDDTVRQVELLRHVPVAVCQFTMDGKVLYRNPEDTKLFGETLHDRFVDQETGEKALQESQKGKHYNVEVQQRLVGGKSRWFSVSLRKGSDPVSGDAVMNYSALDVTEIVQARNDTRKAKSKAEFLSIIAHEIRTPLHQVIGYADLLELLDLSSPQTETVKMIQRSCETLIAIINDLLDYSKIEGGKATIKSVNFSLSELLQGCLQAIQSEATNKGLRLSLIADENLPVNLVGDIDKVRQILLNLLENAVKYTFAGEVSLKVALLSSPSNSQDKESGKSQQRVWIRFAIKDTGMGIDDAHQLVIFDRYQQIDTSNTRMIDGIGLGLAICQGLTGLLGGKISLESVLGQGSTFSVELPFEVTASSHQDANNKAAVSSIMEQDRPLRVLVVEDNEVNRKMVQKMLQKIGHAVLLAENGRVAVDMLEEGTPIDIVLMDIQMPVLDGIEASRFIRKKLRMSRQELPIVGLTASFQHSDLNFYLDAGMNACLSKPVRLGTLKQTLTSVAARCILGLYSEKDG